MLVPSLPALRRFLSTATLTACLLLLGQVPVAHVMSSIRPGAVDMSIPTEEEHRSDTAERVWQAQVALRHRKQVTYQETVEPPPSYRTVIPAAHAVTLTVPPPVFSGAPRPLRC
jgi:hypothetical protein